MILILDRLAEIWKGLTLEEQLTLAEIQKWQRQVADSKAMPGLVNRHTDALARLAAKGLCWRTSSGWRIFCQLLDGYIATVEQCGAENIWVDATTGEL